MMKLKRGNIVAVIDKKTGQIDRLDYILGPPKDLDKTTYNNALSRGIYPNNECLTTIRDYSGLSPGMIRVYPSMRSFIANLPAYYMISNSLLVSVLPKFLDDLITHLDMI